MILGCFICVSVCKSNGVFSNLFSYKLSTESKCLSCLSFFTSFAASLMASLVASQVASLVTCLVAFSSC